MQILQLYFMLKVKQLLILVSVLFLRGLNAQIIPTPTSLIKKDGVFKLPKKITVSAHSDLQKNSGFIEILGNIFSEKLINSKLGMRTLNSF